MKTIRTNLKKTWSLVCATSLCIFAGNALAAPNISSVTISTQSPSNGCPGFSATYTVGVSEGGSPSGNNVTLSVPTTLPAGVTASFSPNPLNFNGNQTLNSTLTLATSPGTPAGTYGFSVKAQSSDGSIASVTTSTGSLVVVPGSPSATTVTASQNPSVSGQSITFSATVSGVSGTPTGKVQFQTNGVNFGAAVALVSGSATSPATAALPVGNTSVTAIYGSDSTYAGSTSPTLTQTVNKADTTTGVASSVNPSVYGQSVKLTATVSAVAPGVGTPTGTVQFQTNGVNFGAAVALASGSASLTNTALAAGNINVTAVYAGDAKFNGSTTSPAYVQTVNLASTTTALAASANPSVSGQTVTFTATVNAVSPGAGTRTGTVTFKIDGTPQVTNNLSSGSATFAVSSLGVGGHSVSATYNGDSNFNPSTSATLTQTVNKASATATVLSSANPSSFGQAVSFTATVAAAAPGSGTPTGTVQFKTNNVAFGAAVALVSGSATSPVTAALPVGNASVTAVYSGDSNFNGATSAALTQTVNKAGTTIALTSSSNPSSQSSPVTFTAVVTPVSGPATPSGTVQFKLNGSNLGSAVTLVNGSATSQATTTLVAGTDTITAVYSGDGNYTTSTTNLTQTVNDDIPPVTASVTTPANGSAFRTNTMPATFSGQVADNSGGIGLNSNSVTFTLKRSVDGRYWTGAKWQAGSNGLATAHSATTGGTTVTWTSAGTLPAWTSANDGVYIVQATATDKAGNSYTGSAVSFVLDDMPPAVASVTTPANGAGYPLGSAPGTVSGQVADNAGGAGLAANSTTFTIQRASDGLYWNGGNWKSGAYNLAATNPATTGGTMATWGFVGTGNSSLPTWTGPETYTIQATVSDKLGNSFTGAASQFAVVSAFTPLAGTSKVFTNNVNLILADSGVTVPAGRTVFVTVAANPGTYAVSVSDTAGNTYTKDADVNNTNGVRTLVFSGLAATGLTNGTITVNFSTPWPATEAANFFAMAGIASPAADQSQTNTGIGDAVNSGTTALTTQPDEVLIGAMGFDAGSSGSGNMTPGSNFVALASANSPPGQGNEVRIQTEYRYVNATNSYYADGTDNQNTDWAAAIVAYKKIVPAVTGINLVSATGDTAVFTVNFSENVYNVSAADFVTVVSNGVTGALTGAYIVSITGSGSNYVVTVTGSGMGYLALGLVDNDSIVDIYGTPLGGTGTDAGDGSSASQSQFVGQTLSIYPQANGQVLLTGYGAAQTAYTIQATTNLCSGTWVTVGIPTSDNNGLYSLMDQDATNYPCRFYRSVTP